MSDSDELHDESWSAGYEVGYTEGGRSAWASLEAVLDEYGEEALVDFVRRKISQG